MRKSASFLVLVLFFAFGLVEVRPQSNDKKFEVGGQFSVLRVPTQTVSSSAPVAAMVSGSAINEHGNTNYGFGARFGYQVSEYFTLEAEGNFFPRDSDLDAGRKMQAVFGLKAGKRLEKFGVFAKARPGFVHYSRGDYQSKNTPCPFMIPGFISCDQPVGRTNFAADLGGVFEYYPTKRTIIRFDIGDTIVRLPKRVVAVDVLGFEGEVLYRGVLPKDAETKHHFQGSAGFGWRF